ncbi:hypothetical protein K1T71_003627 [Dendrolimus kikuchii]|uniref:Uncharacterized protein n=1 Tax=Dendrolimus kikuchii TaxID=765133 RepID=A0ACC1D9G2_9NEOP|nr:hypothetical protein K1T71_003627 [Dendrolimus kikuchii]
MSAVMSTLSMISGGRRTHRKLASSGRKSGQFSDVGEDRSRSQHDLNKHQRSASLQTLETGGVTGGVVNLETLEAKMASIEVSLAGNRRRSAGARDSTRELDALRTALSDKDNLIQSLKKQLSASLSAARLAAQASPTAPRSASQEDSVAALSTEDRRALEERAAAVKSDMETSKANIQDLVRRLEKTHVTDNIDTRIQYAELQYKLGREELELQTLSEQARALAQLIEQADAAAERSQRATLYSTIRECGGTASLIAVEAREGSWGASPRGAGMAVEWVSDHATLRLGDRLIEVNGTSMVACRSQEELQRAISASTPAKVVVMRGQPLVQAQPPHPSGFTQNEAASLRAELGALRVAAEEAEKAKEGLRTDNTRLTHRISYLEEQVAELLARHPQLQSASSNDSCITVNKTKKNVTNINITSEPQSRCRSPKSEVQVFQKGPDITAIVAKLPGLDGAEANLPLMRPRSNASGASSRTAVSPRASPPPNIRSHSSHSLEHRVGQMRHSLSHHCIHGAVDYSVETDAAIRMIERNQRHIEKQRLKAERLGRKEDYFRSDSDLDIHDSRSVDRTCNRHYEIKKAADRIEESIKKTNWAERKTLSIIEQLKKSQRLRKLKKNESTEDIQIDSERQYIYSRIDGKVLENAHKSSRRTSKVHSRSAKSSEFESECSDFPNGDTYNSSSRIDYCSETSRMSHYKKNEDRTDVKSRPTPPRKPLRLSLHKARSAHSLINGSESETTSRPASEANNDVECNKRPVKRTHAADKWSRERIRDGSRATPRPTRKILNGLSACEAPAADDLYPDSHMPVRVNGVGQSAKWC